MDLNFLTFIDVKSFLRKKKKKRGLYNPGGNMFRQSGRDPQLKSCSAHFSTGMSFFPKLYSCLDILEELWPLTLFSENCGLFLRFSMENILKIDVCTH